MGKRLRELRENAGYTQDTFGKAVGVTGAQIYKYESGISNVNIPMAVKMSSALGMPAISFIMLLLGEEAVGRDTGGCRPEHHDVIAKASIVLSSGTCHADTLKQAIDSLNSAVENEQTIKNFQQEFNSLKRRVTDMERGEVPLLPKRPA